MTKNVVVCVSKRTADRGVVHAGVARESKASHCIYLYQFRARGPIMARFIVFSISWVTFPAIIAFLAVATVDGLLSEAAFDQVLLADAAQTQGAVCLDGSPAAYYIHKGSGSGANKWIFFLQGCSVSNSAAVCLPSSSRGNSCAPSLHERWWVVCQ